MVISKETFCAIFGHKKVFQIGMVSTYPNPTPPELYRDRVLCSRCGKDLSDDWSAKLSSEPIVIFKRK